MSSDRIAKLRALEDRLTALKTSNEDERRATNVAHWQAKSDEKMRNITVQRRMEVLQQRRDTDVDARRHKLAQKLLAEDTAYKQELLASRETPEQRRAKLAARARELAGKREAERQALAAKLYDQAFQENCDVLRETNSKRVLYRTLDERTAQIEQRMAQRIVEEEEARYFTEMNEAARMQAESRHLEETRKRTEMKQETVRILDQQVRDLEARRESDATARKQEIAELKALWDAMEADQAAADAADKQRMLRLRMELQEFNRLKQAELGERERTERELDLQILQDALAREAAEEARDAAAHEQRAADIKRYREQLAHVMAQEIEASAERDALIEAIAAGQRAKQDAEWAAREEARRQLMAEVDAIRQQQIRDKQGLFVEGQRQVAADRVAAQAAAAQEEAEKAAARAQQQRRALELRLQVQTQMVAKAHIKAAEEDEKLRASEVTQQAERAYMTQVKDVLATSEPAKWHGRKKMVWN